MPFDIFLCTIGCSAIDKGRLTLHLVVFLLDYIIVHIVQNLHCFTMSLKYQWSSCLFSITFLGRRLWFLWIITRVTTRLWLFPLTQHRNYLCTRIILSGSAARCELEDACIGSFISCLLNIWIFCSLLDFFYQFFDCDMNGFSHNSSGMLWFLCIEEHCMVFPSRSCSPDVS